MNHHQRARADLREHARHRVRTATRWATLASTGLAAAFAVVLAHQAAAAAPHSGDTAVVAPQTTTAQNSPPPLQPPAQAPSAGTGGNDSGLYGNYGSSGGS